MTLIAILLLSILTALLTFLLGTLVLDAFWTIRSRAAERSPLLGPLPQPVPVRSRPAQS